MTHHEAETASSTCRVCGRALPRSTSSSSSSSSPTCSVACARDGLDDVDHQIEGAIASLLAARSHDATICPSEACRAVFGDVDAAHMERVRRAARRLVAAGQLQITQGGVVVDPSRARGPIRLRRRAAPVEVPRVPRRKRRTHTDVVDG